MNQLFEHLLKNYEFDERFKEPFKEQMLLTYNSLTSNDKEAVRAAKQQLSSVEAKLEKVEERFAFGEIDRAVFDKVAAKLNEEKQKLEAQIEGPKNKLSNPSSCIDNALKICSNLSDLWVSADFDSKLKLQEILFPGVLCMIGKMTIIEPLRSTLSSI